MAGITGPGKGGLNTELNLVPFIDLLSALVLFLLITAAWLQVGVIPASIKSQGSASRVTTETNRLRIHLSASGYRLQWPGRASRPFPQRIGRTPSGYDSTRLITVLKQAVKSNGISSAAVSADDDVAYGLVIEALDSAKSSGIPQVAISTN